MISAMSVERLGTSGPSESMSSCGDRATALIEGIWCEKICDCSDRGDNTYAGAELRSLTKGLPSRSNVRTRRTCGPQGGNVSQMPCRPELDVS